MNTYRHTQIGYLMIVVALLVAALYAWIYRTMSLEMGGGFELSFVTALMAAIVFVLASLSTLTVTIDGTHVRVKYGYGLIRRKFLLADIALAQAVRNHWYYGWGVRVWFWPFMIIYNVSGLDAVEIRLSNGKIYRIGTDDPSGLEAALKARKA